MDEKLTTLLKEMLIIFNKGARLVPPQLEADMCLALDKLGGEWLLRGLEAQAIDGASEMRQNPDVYLNIVRNEAGQKQLQDMIEKNMTAVKAMRRKTVSVMRALKPGDPRLEFSFDRLTGDGGIYQMLSEEKKSEGG